MFSGPVLAQGGATNYEPERFLILMQGHTMGGFSGSGPSSAFGVSVADVGGANPAALGTFERPAVGLAYQLETSVDDGWLGGIGYEPMNDARPQSAAVVVPLGVWAFGVSYNQRYAAEMDFDPIPVQSPENPEIDPNLTYEATWTSRLETISPQIAYRSVLRNGNELAVGLRLGLGYGQYESRLDSATVSLADWGTQVALGVSYRRPDAYGLAVYYETRLTTAGRLAGSVAGSDGRGRGRGRR